MRISIAFALALCLQAASTAVLAGEPACIARYTFKKDQHREGVLETRPGKACTSRIYTSGDTTLRSIQVVQSPKNASVTMLGPSSYRFKPRSGFSGEDTMVLRFNMTSGAAAKPSAGTVLVRISIR
jgi:hypothetical protein